MGEAAHCSETSVNQHQVMSVQPWSPEACEGAAKSNFASRIVPEGM
jgi:hypothetical protein